MNFKSLEVEMKYIKEMLDEVRHDVKSLRKSYFIFQGKVIGVAVAFSFIINLAFKFWE